MSMFSWVAADTSPMGCGHCLLGLLVLGDIPKDQHHARDKTGEECSAHP